MLRDTRSCWAFGVYVLIACFASEAVAQGNSSHNRTMSLKDFLSGQSSVRSNCAGDACADITLEIRQKCAWAIHTGARAILLRAEQSGQVVQIVMDAPDPTKALKRTQLLDKIRKDRKQAEDSAPARALCERVIAFEAVKAANPQPGLRLQDKLDSPERLKEVADCKAMLAAPAVAEVDLSQQASFHEQRFDSISQSRYGARFLAKLTPSNGCFTSLQNLKYSANYSNSSSPPAASSGAEKENRTLTPQWKPDLNSGPWDPWRNK